MPRANPGLIDGIPLGFARRRGGVGVCERLLRTARMRMRTDNFRRQSPRGTETRPTSNPNGIEITQPRVARSELPWESNRQSASTLKGLNHRANDATTLAFQTARLSEHVEKVGHAKAQSRKGGGFHEGSSALLSLCVRLRWDSFKHALSVATCRAVAYVPGASAAIATR